MEYKIVSVPLVLSANSAFARLAKAVNDAIALGWEPLGGPKAIRDTALCQAMIKRR